MKRKCLPVTIKSIVRDRSNKIIHEHIETNQEHAFSLEITGLQNYQSVYIPDNTGAIPEYPISVKLENFYFQHKDNMIILEWRYNNVY